MHDVLRRETLPREDEGRSGTIVMPPPRPSNCQKTNDRTQREECTDQRRSHPQSAQPTRACGVASGYASAMMPLASKSGREDLEQGDEIAESLALDENVLTDRSAAT